MQSNPIGHSGGMNLYAYVSGDPVNKIDPWGLKDECMGTKTVTEWPDGTTTTEIVWDNSAACNGTGGGGNGYWGKPNPTGNPNGNDYPIGGGGDISPKSNDEQPKTKDGDDPEPCETYTPTPGQIANDPLLGAVLEAGAQMESFRNRFRPNSDENLYASVFRHRITGEYVITNLVGYAGVCGQIGCGAQFPSGPFGLGWQRVADVMNPGRPGNSLGQRRSLYGSTYYQPTQADLYRSNGRSVTLLSEKGSYRTCPSG